METFEARLTRFLDNEWIELPATLLNSLHNVFVNEIQEAGKRRLEHLVFLGTHAIMQTVSESVFDRTGFDGTRFYLQRFVDGPTADKKFSEIADVLHELRNVTAHRWLSSMAHSLDLDYTMSEGWVRRANVLAINPDVYLECFSEGFRRGGPIWQYRSFWPEDERLVRKYRLLARWLDLDKKDPICDAIGVLASARDTATVAAAEVEIKRLVRERYGL